MTSPIITEAIRVVIDRRDLTRIEAAAAMEAIMTGAATNAQIAAFLTALRMKGETVEELIGFAQVMREKVARVLTRGEETAALTGTDREMLIDTCGTGGDASGTFNVSTATAFVVSGAGLKVARVHARAEETAALTGTDREMLIDTCGTGGDASGTFNVSTATAFVVSGAGLKVAKHGNRSMSGLSGASLCGSADVV